MQQCAFRRFLVRLPPPSLRLNGGTLAKHFDVATISGIQEGGPVNPPWHRKLVMDLEAQSLGVEFE